MLPQKFIIKVVDIKHIIHLSIAFLSHFKGIIGRKVRVKSEMIKGCTDLVVSARMKFSARVNLKTITQILSKGLTNMRDC